MLLQKLQQFMYGRYGGDKLNLIIIIISLLLSVLSRIFGFISFYILSTALLIFALFRMLSRNIPQRQRENAAFMKFWSHVENWFRSLKNGFRSRQTHKYFKCPACKQKLRAPRGRGKIQVTCQKCHNVFITKT